VHVARSSAISNWQQAPRRGESELVGGKPLDLIIVGGGLAGALAALAVAKARPDLRLLLIEQGGSLGGNHTWSFFETDLSPEGHALVAPLVAHSWPGYRVRFPAHTRLLETGYRSITSGLMGAHVAAALGDRVQLTAEIAAMSTTSVTYASGETLAARCVIDARGQRTSPHLALGFQKFLGLELRLIAPHGESLPTIMDASVPQTDGYRFVYTLPLAPDRLLIEDTYYSDGGDLAIDAIRERIGRYATARGWQFAETVRVEHGILPIILAGDIDRHLAAEAHEPPRIGLAAALFHPTTGYSLPDAVRTALLIADLVASGPPLTTARLRTALEQQIRTLWRERSYFRLLNRMMFHAGPPAERYRILERFYRLDEALVQRFYAARLAPADRLAIVCGRPPVPILSALGCVSESATLKRMRART